MKKFCPNCGARIQPGDKFCPHCGYDLSKIEEDDHHQKAQEPSTQPQAQAERREQYHEPNHQKHSTLMIVLIVVVIVIGMGGFLMYRHQTSTSNNAANSNSTSQTSNNQNTNTGNDSNNSTENEDKISSSIGPKETVAAITIYAAHHGNHDWQALLDHNSDLTVRLDSDDDDLDKLNEPGAGMAYEVFGYHDVDSDDDTDFVYTLSKDDTVNIYKIDDGFDDSDGNLDPVESVSKSSIIHWLNDHGYADKVKSMTNNVEMDD